MYFSRAPIPYCRDEWELQIKEHGAPNTDYKSTFELRTPAPERQVFYCYKHIGIYGFRKDALINFSSMKQSRLEQIERLEQLRALSCGMKIKVKETGYDVFGIDTMEDLKRAEEWLSLYS